MGARDVQAVCRTVQFVVHDWARTARLITILITVLVVIVLYRQLAMH
jgi:hypothetical protein